MGWFEEEIHDLDSSQVRKLTNILEFVGLVDIETVDLATGTMKGREK